MSMLPSALLPVYGPPVPETPADSRKRQHAARVTAALALLVACATFPALCSNEDPFSARLDLHGVSARWACVDHRRVPVTPGADGYAALPPGSRVTIAVDPRDAVRGTAHCVPAVSFVPRAGQAYFAGYDTRGGHCGLTVYREVKSNRLGLGLEPTLAAAQDCARP